MGREKKGGHSYLLHREEDRLSLRWRHKTGEKMVEV